MIILDTNILMHDPAAIYHFEEHDIYLPMVVLEELDNHKTGISEVARNVRQTNRMLVELMSNATHQQIVAGLPIPNFFDKAHVKNNGRLFFQTDEFDSKINEKAQPLLLVRIIDYFPLPEKMMRRVWIMILKSSAREMFSR